MLAKMQTLDLCIITLLMYCHSTAAAIISCNICDSQLQISVIVAENMGVGPKILWLRAFRTLRVLRPLKFIRRFEGMSRREL